MMMMMMMKKKPGFLFEKVCFRSEKWVSTDKGLSIDKILGEKLTSSIKKPILSVQKPGFSIEKVGLSAKYQVSRILVHFPCHNRLGMTLRFPCSV